MRLSRLLVRASPWLVLCLLPFLVHAPLWLRGVSADPIYVTAQLAEAGLRQLLPGLPGWLDPNAGFTTAALGGLAARDWLHGIVPWWNPYNGVGMPLAAEMQPAAFFLPFTLLLALRDGVLWNKIALQAVAGLATFGLLGELRMARWVALVGGMLFELNGTFAWWSHAPINPVPFLPLLLLGIARAGRFAAARRPGGWGWIAVALAASLYAGFPEVAYLDGLLALLWAGGVALSAGRAVCLPAAGRIAIGGVVGLMLAAPVVLPFLQLLPVSEIGIHPTVGDAPMEPSVWSLLLVPYLQGPLGSTSPWYLAGGYLGLPLIWLALLALRPRGGHAGLRWILAGWRSPKATSRPSSRRR